MGKDEPADSQPIIVSGEEHGCPWAEEGWFELSPCQGVNSLHTFAIEKKLREEEFSLKYSIESCVV
jgi:hypothetical protein